MQRKPKVHVIVLGGTITMMPQALGGVVPTLDGEALTQSVHGLGALAEISVSTPFLVPSASITLGQIVDVAGLVRDAVHRGADGVVVVQGTDTIDETSFALDLMLKLDAPVVVTGAMRNPATIGADGPANLLAAVTVAAALEARGRGVLVTLNDEVHAARFVEKLHSIVPSAFDSPGRGPIGEVVEGALQIICGYPRNRLANDIRVRSFVDVALLTATLGDDGRLLSVVAPAGYRGAVIVGMGGGHLPEAVADEAAALAQIMPVVLATRVPGGPILQRTYGYKGSERDLLGRGLIAAGRLSPTKARLLLAGLLGADIPTAALPDYFSTY